MSLREKAEAVCEYSRLHWPQRTTSVGFMESIPAELIIALRAELAKDDERDASRMVAGRSLNITIAEFEFRCKTLLSEEQRKANPDNVLILVLCDAVRLAREYVGSMGDRPQESERDAALEEAWKICTDEGEHGLSLAILALKSKPAAEEKPSRERTSD